jgi:hypothetical protein
MASALAALFTLAMAAMTPSTYTFTDCPIRFVPDIVAIVLPPALGKLVGVEKISVILGTATVKLALAESSVF